MPDPPIIRVEATGASTTSRIVVKGTGDTRDRARVVVKGAADATRRLTSGGARDARRILGVGGVEAASLVMADQARAISALQAASMSTVEREARWQELVSRNIERGFGVVPQDLIVAAAAQQALTHVHYSTLAQSAWTAAPMHAGMMAAEHARLRLTSVGEIRVNPVAEAIMRVLDDDPDERFKAACWLTDWLLKRRLRPTGPWVRLYMLFRADPTQVQWAMLIAIREHCGPLTPREAMDQLPALVCRWLGEPLRQRSAVRLDDKSMARAVAHLDALVAAAPKTPTSGLLRGIPFSPQERKAVRETLKLLVERPDVRPRNLARVLSARLRITPQNAGMLLGRVRQRMTAHFSKKRRRIR